MAKMHKKSLGEFGPFLAMRPKGREVQESIDEALRALPPGGVLAIDFDGVEMMDYSFADEALGTIFSRMSGKEYPDRYLVLIVKDDPVSIALLENVEVALSQRDAGGDHRAFVGVAATRIHLRARGATQTGRPIHREMARHRQTARTLGRNLGRRDEPRASHRARCRRGATTRFGDRVQQPHRPSAPTAIGAPQSRHRARRRQIVLLFGRILGKHKG